jgi:hypothetical protein
MRGLVVGLALALVAGCGRKVVLDPSDVPARNDPAWTVRQAPGAAPAAAAPAAAAPTPPRHPRRRGADRGAPVTASR